MTSTDGTIIEGPAAGGPALLSDPLMAVGQFSVGIAHDFNNVLAIILANARLMIGSLRADEPVPDELRDIVAAAEVGAAMVRRMVRFARQEPTVTARVSLNVVANTLARMVRRMLPDAIRIKLDCASSPLMVIADTGAIEEIVLNLVTNARDAMPNGGTLRLEVRTASRDAGLDACGMRFAAGDYVTISVRDTGMGLDDATRRRMFEPFFTTKPLGEGSGLGLAMSNTLVRQLHGFIEVASTPGVGTTVVVSLPADASGPVVPGA